MVVEILVAHRLKGAGADVQRDVREAHAARIERGQHRVVEVQAGGRRGDRAGLARVDRLVALAVARLGVAPDIRRQRHVAVALEQLEPGIAVLPQYEQIAIARAHLAFDAALEDQARARLRRLARAQLREQRVLVEHAFDQHLDLAAAILAPEQARRDHARIVEHQQVTRFDQRGEVGEKPVVEAIPRRVDAEQARRAAILERRLRDQVLGKLVVEIAESHRPRRALKSAHDTGKRPPRVNKSPARAARSRYCTGRRQCFRMRPSLPGWRNW